MSKKINILCHLVKIIGFIVVLVLVTNSLSELLIRKDEYNKYKGFYEEKENFDVLFFGSSRVLDCFQPMWLWEDYGITSYNMAQHSEGIGRTYWSIKNAIKYNKPQVAVIDVSLFYGSIGIDEDSSEEDKAYLHNSLDHMPLSITKLQAIGNLVPKSLWYEYIFPMAKYHSRWNQLTQSDFYKGEAYNKGAEERNSVEPQERVMWMSEDEAEVFIPENINLDKIIDLCESENIEMVFICMPSTVDYCHTSYNSFTKYFAERDITFLNIYKDEDFLDYSADFADSSHVNPSGGRKITNYLGNYLIENYAFDNKNEKTVKAWNEVLSKYE